MQNVVLIYTYKSGLNSSITSNSHKPEQL